MTTSPFSSGSIGMEVFNLQDNLEFAQRSHRSREVAREIEAMQRLARVFSTSPLRILRELVAIVIELCGAESAGVSLEETTPGGEKQFRWIATAGTYAPLLGAVLPNQLAPCAICLERNQPQLLRLSRPYLDSLGVDAPAVADGILIPWRVSATRGTIWALSHNSCPFFDIDDYRILQDLSEFAAIAVRDQAHREKLARQAANAASAMANELAHRINNPLQSLMNTVFLASQGGTDADVFARQATDDLLKLSTLVKDLLQQPTARF